MAVDIGGASGATFNKAASSFKSNTRLTSPPTYPMVNAPYFNLEILSTDANPVSFSWNGGAPDYFTSLSHNRIVEGANTGQISISYVPTQGSGKTINKGDPNYIEAALTAAHGRCRFQYGMTGYKSPYYDALIYDYKATLNEGRLDYVFNMISREIGALNTMIPNSDVYDIPEESERSNTFNDRAYLHYLVNTIIKKYLNSDYEFEDGLADSADFLEQYEWQFGNVPSESMSLDYYEGYRVLLEDATLTSDYKFVPSSITISGHNALEAINILAVSLMNPSDSLEHYYIDIDDEVRTGSKKKIRLLRTKGKNVGSSAPIEYAFDWYHRDSTVISWSPNYKGVALLFQDVNPISEVGTDENGKPKVYTNEINDAIRMSGASQVFTSGAYSSYFGTFDAESVQDYSNMQTQQFKRIANYPYDASITVLGIPTNTLYVGDHITVRPYLKGELHHSAGEYFVKKIIDTVDDYGFRTQMDLTRINALEDLGKVETPISRKQVIKPGGKAEVYTNNITVATQVEK